MNIPSPVMSSSMLAATVPQFAFDSSHKSAATVVFVFAVISTLVLSIVLLGVLWVVIFVVFKRTPSENLTRYVFFFRSQLGQYAFSLLLSKWFSALSGLITIKWIREGGVTTGSYCASQGALFELGEFGSTFFVVAMGLHTFNTLVLRNRQPQWVGPVVAAFGWAAALALGLGPLTMLDRAGGPMYNIGHLSCGFSRSSPLAHMLLFFLPMLLGALLSAIVYPLIFLVLRGSITINGGLRFQLDPERRLRLPNQSFEEYQSFVYSVSRTMLWLPTTFILALFPSAIVQSMDISGIDVSTGSMAFSYVLVYLDGIFDVLILFNILRVLGLVVKSQNGNVPPDSEKGLSNRGRVSRPMYDWKPRSTLTQAQFMRTAPPARPPGTILQESAPRPLSFGTALFKPHKKAGSTSSTTRLLTPELLSRNYTPSPSLNGTETSVATTVVRKPVVPASASDAGLSFPPSAMRKHTETGPPLQLLTANPPSRNGSASLTPYSHPGRARISSSLSPILVGSPSPQSAAPFLEVTLHSPAVDDSPTTGGGGSLVSMYISRKSARSSDLPPFPAPAVPRDSPVGSPPSPYVPPVRRVPAASTVGSQAVVPHEGVVSPPKVAGGYGRIRSSTSIPNLPPAPIESPGDSTDASHYSDSDSWIPSPPPQEPEPSLVLPVLRTTQPLRFGRAAKVNAAASERRSLDTPQFSDRSVPRTLPVPPSRPGGQHSPSIYSRASSMRQGSSSFGGYR